MLWIQNQRFMVQAYRLHDTRLLHKEDAGFVDYLSSGCRLEPGAFLPKPTGEL